MSSLQATSAKMAKCFSSLSLTVCSSLARPTRGSVAAQGPQSMTQSTPGRRQTPCCSTLAPPRPRASTPPLRRLRTTTTQQRAIVRSHVTSHMTNLIIKMAQNKLLLKCYKMFFYAFFSSLLGPQILQQ